MVVVLSVTRSIIKSLALKFVELVVDGKAREVSILDTKSCILALNKKALFISLPSSLT